MKQIDMGAMETITNFASNADRDDFISIFGSSRGDYLWHKFSVTLSGCLTIFYQRMDFETKIDFVSGINRWVEMSNEKQNKNTRR